MSNANRAMRTMMVFSLAMIAALLAAVVLACGVAEAQRGGGGGGGGKPTGVSKPSNADRSPSAKSGEKGVSSGLYSPGYGVRHGALSNFFLWA